MVGAGPVSPPHLALPLGFWKRTSWAQASPVGSGRRFAGGVREAEGGSWQPPEGPRPVLTPQRGRVELSLSGFPLLSCEVGKRRVG